MIRNDASVRRKSSETSSTPAHGSPARSARHARSSPRTAPTGDLRLVYELDAGDRGIFFDAIPNVASSRLLDDTAYVKLWTTFDGGGDDGPVAAHDAPPAAEVHEATGG